MATWVDGNLTLRIDAAIEQYRLVRDDGTGVATKVGASDTDFLGVTRADYFNADDAAAIIPYNKTGTVIGVASEAITVGAVVYAAADGKLATTGTLEVGRARAAASGDNSFFEFIFNRQFASLPRTSLAQENGVRYPISLSAAKTWDDRATNLPATAANDDLAIITGTFGTDDLAWQSADSGQTSVTQKLGFEYNVPPEYVAGETLNFVVNAAMLVVADTSATLDVEAVRQADPTTDIVTTAAEDINSATPADKTFVLDPTDLVPGDKLDIVLTVAIVDAATVAANVTAELLKPAMLADIKG
jgi:hypothetical protein